MPLTVIRAAGAGLDVQALAFAGLAALVVTVLSGTLPALRLSRVRLGEALAGPRGMDGSPRRSPRRLLVIGEVALSLMLVLCATLLAQSYAELRAVQLGFRTDNIVALRMDLPPADYPGLRAHQSYRDAVSRFGALPEVEDAGAVRVLPLTGTIGDWSITIEHQPAVQGENPNGDWQVVSPGYFDTMGIQIARGRPIASTDTEASPPVAVVNETMAARYWPGQDPIGKRFHLGTLDQPWVEIVGLVRNIRHNAVVEDPRAEMYLAHPQWPAVSAGSPRLGMTLVARVVGDPRSALPRLRDEIRALDPALPVTDTWLMDDIAAAALAEPRFTTMLLAAFAGLALILAAVGLHGLVAFVTARRTREIGVRVALGARPSGVWMLVVGDSLAMTAVGVVLGLMGSFWATRWIAGQLYAVSPLDPATFIAAPAVLVGVSLVASLVPAWRAMRASPVDALRMD